MMGFVLISLSGSTALDNTTIQTVSAKVLKEKSTYLPSGNLSSRGRGRGKESGRALLEGKTTVPKHLTHRTSFDCQRKPMRG